MHTLERAKQAARIRLILTFRFDIPSRLLHDELRLRDLCLSRERLALVVAELERAFVLPPGSLATADTIGAIAERIAAKTAA